MSEDPTTHPGCESQRGRDGVHRNQFCIFCLRKRGDDALGRVDELESVLRAIRDHEQSRPAEVQSMYTLFAADAALSNT